jgi:hypothetical protein
MNPFLPCKTLFGIRTSQFNIHRLPLPRQCVRILRILGLLWALSGLMARAVTQSQPTIGVVDVPLVITLLNAHMSPASIIALIQDKGNTTNFVLSPENIKALNAAAVTPEVLYAMFSAAAQSSANTSAAAQASPLSVTASPNPAPPVVTPMSPTTTEPGDQSSKPAKKAVYPGPPTNPCAAVKNLPSLLGNLFDGQQTIEGCVDTNTSEGSPITGVYIEVAEVGKIVKCTDTVEADFPQRELTATFEPIATDEKFKKFTYNLDQKLKAGERVCLVEAFTDAKKNPSGYASFSSVTVKPSFKDMAPLGEALVGVDVEGASSASPQAVLLALGNFDLPLENFNTLSTANHPFWVSGSLGLKGMAQPGSLSGIASPGFYASAASANPDQIVQSVDASLHLAWQFRHWWIPMGTFDSGSPVVGGQIVPSSTFATLSLIAGGGAITPLSISQTMPQVYEATPIILKTQTPIAPFSSFAPSCSASPTTTPTCYVVFIPSDRTHFYRSYDAGLRLKLYAKDYDDNELRFPAIMDFTLGQNEYVTGGNFHGTVLHLGGSFPFPRIDSVYAFGSFDMGMSLNNGGGPQLQLIPAPVTAGLSPTSPSVYTILTSQPNRDRYELGFGIDIYHLFSKYLKANKQAANQPDQTQSQ